MTTKGIQHGWTSMTDQIKFLQKKNTLNITHLKRTFIEDSNVTTRQQI